MESEVLYILLTLTDDLSGIFSIYIVTVSTKYFAIIQPYIGVCMHKI